MNKEDLDEKEDRGPELVVHTALLHIRSYARVYPESTAQLRM